MLISETTQPETQKIRLICQAAQLVLENGGETYRVEETVAFTENTGLYPSGCTSFSHHLISLRKMRL